MKRARCRQCVVIALLINFAMLALVMGLAQTVPAPRPHAATVQARQ